MTFWDFCAPFYDFAQRQNSAYKKMVEYVATLVPPNAKVIEVAAGTGDLSLAVALKAETVLCTDLSEKMLKIAEMKSKRKNLSGIFFETRSIYDLGGKDCSYDVVIASQILHLLDEPQKAADELKRVTSGQVIIPLALIKNLSGINRLRVGIWKLFGFKPKQNFDYEEYKAFLGGIGFGNCEIKLIEGSMPMAVAIWQK